MSNMFKNVSMTGTGLLVLVIGSLLGWLGVDFSESQVVELTTKIIEISALLWVIYGQLRRKDLSWGFWRK